MIDETEPRASGPAGTQGPDGADVMQFPMEFPVKIMGPQSEGFEEAIVQVVRAHAPDFDPATLERRASTGARYLSLTATINATSRAQLDGLYQELSSHPLVKVAL